jgi:predicted RNA-binding protein
MCSSTAYFRRESSEEVVLQDVMHLVPQGTGFRLVGLLGDEKVLADAHLVEIDFENNRIVLAPSS